MEISVIISRNGIQLHLQLHLFASGPIYLHFSEGENLIKNKKGAGANADKGYILAKGFCFKNNWYTQTTLSELAIYLARSCLTKTIESNRFIYREKLEGGGGG